MLQSLKMGMMALLIGAVCACSGDNISEVERMIESKYSEGVLNGAYVLVDNGERKLFKTEGLANQVTGDTITRHSAFRIASLTKLYTDVIILRLIQNRELDIDKSINEYLPLNASWSSKVTTGHLLASQSGLPREIPGQLGVSLASGRIIPQLQQIDTLRALSEPGIEYRYSNVGYWLLGALIEGVTGDTYQTNLRQLCSEIGLKNTGFDNGTSGHQDFAIGYLSDNSEARKVDYVSRFSSGGIYSSAEDLSIFYTALLNNTLIGPELSRQYFFEIHKDGKRGAGAHLPGFVHHAILDYNEKQFLVSLNNVQPADIARISSIANEVFATLKGESFHEPPLSSNVVHVKLKHVGDSLPHILGPYVSSFIASLNTKDSMRIAEMYASIIDAKIDSEMMSRRMNMMREVDSWDIVGYEDWGDKGLNLALENKENQTSATIHFRMPNENGKIPDPDIDWRPEFILRWVHSLWEISAGWPETSMQKKVDDVLEAYKTQDGEKIRAALTKNFNQNTKTKKFCNHWSIDFLEQIEEYLGGFEPIEYKQINANELLVVIIGPKAEAEIQLLFISSAYEDDVLLEMKAVIQNRSL